MNLSGAEKKFIDKLDRMLTCSLRSLSPRERETRLKNLREYLYWLEGSKVKKDGK